jgi:1,4-alpha-glucan branching enzyme
MLPLSHDEVVYGKKSILGRMPGDEWQRFSNLRLMYGYMFTHPGTKLNFMGNEFGQQEEWNFEESLDWNLLEHKSHKETHNYFKALNTFYRNTPALFEKGFDPNSFEWIAHDDSVNSVISYIRKGKKSEVIVICNMTPNPLTKYKIGVPKSGKLKEIFNSDAEAFGGSGISNSKLISPIKTSWNGKKFSAEITVPPLGFIVFKQN